ncbi:MAG TPA: nitrate reductase subunit beta, partial [Micromonosporaceae bacterium]|nr:nitrate reductase subunit beta [Micromonosporaceae bacterium]
LDPNDPDVVNAARDAGIPDDWIDAARRSPIWDLIMRYRVALPLHPEYRTMPMVWYIPPLSPVVDALRDTGHDGEDLDNLFGAVDALRIPVDYLAWLFTAGDPVPVTAALRRLAAMRSYIRRINLGEAADESIAEAVGMDGEQIGDMYRLLAIAKYHERYVIPEAHAETAAGLEELATGCSLDYEGGPGMGGSGPFGESSGRYAPIAVENFQALAVRQRAEHVGETDQRPVRLNLLNWDGNGRPPGMFPPSPDAAAPPGPGAGEEEP